MTPIRDLIDRLVARAAPAAEQEQPAPERLLVLLDMAALEAEQPHLVPFCPPAPSPTPPSALWEVFWRYWISWTTRLDRWAHTLFGTPRP